MNTLTIKCAGNAGLIATLLKEYGIETTGVTGQLADTQLLSATGYGFDARTLQPGLFKMLAILVVDNSIESFTFTRSTFPGIKG